MKLLIVEDDADTLDIMSAYLGSVGFIVTVAETASIARIKIRDYLHDAILLDFCLSGLDVASFVREVRARNPSIRIILASGIDGIDTIAESLECKGFLKKPYDPEEAAKLLESLSFARPELKAVSG
jgi:two-component system OmpR family response regulator